MHNTPPSVGEPGEEPANENNISQTWWQIQLQSVLGYLPPVIRYTEDLTIDWTSPGSLDTYPCNDKQNPATQRAAGFLLPSTFRLIVQAQANLPTVAAAAWLHFRDVGKWQADTVFQPGAKLPRAWRPGGKIINSDTDYLANTIFFVSE